MSEPAFPLHWPAGWPRASGRNRAKFGEGGRGVSMTQALDFVEHELRLLSGQHPVISTNLATRLDGRPYANQGRPNDSGVAVYFTFKQRRIVLACDKWDCPEANLWAIAKDIEAQRGRIRWGVGSVEQAFAGYAALPGKRGLDCWEQLGIAPGSNEAAVIAAWREKAKTAHPDAGGSVEAFTALNDAKDIALATLKSGRVAA